MNQPPDVMQFLLLVLGPLGAGKAVQALVDWICELSPRVLTPQERFYLAQVLAFVVPLAAYGLLVALQLYTWKWTDIIWEIGVGYMVSQQFHRADEQRARQGQILAQRASRHRGAPVPPPDGAPAAGRAAPLTRKLAADLGVPLDPDKGEEEPL